jgi:hypothetical protein
MRLSLATRAAALAGLSAGSRAPAHADDFYKGKTLNIVAGYMPGGGFDANARLLSRYIAKYIPGKPNIIVTNMLGAASQTAVQYLDAKAPRDGTVIVTFNFGLITDSLLIPDRVKIDFRKYNWIGSVGMDIAVCDLWCASGAKTLDDAKKMPVVHMGLTSVGTSNDINQRVLKTIFGVKLQQVPGYPGSTELRLATERGELDGDCGAWRAISPEWLEGKKINPILRTAPIEPPDMPKERGRHSADETRWRGDQVPGLVGRTGSAVHRLAVRAGRSHPHPARRVQRHDEGSGFRRRRDQTAPAEHAAHRRGGDQGRRGDLCRAEERRGRGAQACAGVGAQVFFQGFTSVTSAPISCTPIWEMSIRETLSLRPYLAA